jgi:hypothetical protein
MGTIEQLILDVRAWLHLLMDGVELPSQVGGPRPATAGGTARANDREAARLGTHPPRAA